jgi:hypothetical protein
MKIPPPPQRIDIEAAREAIASGDTPASYARRTGASAQGVRQALRRAGVVVRRRPSQLRTAADRRLYGAWCRMRGRANSSERYGASVAGICAAWREFDAFRRWSLANGYHPDRFIVLRDRSRGYSPSNCRWSTRSALLRQGRKLHGPGSRGIRAFGEVKTPADWARDRRCRVKLTTLSNRLRDGIRPEAAIGTPRGEPLPKPSKRHADLYAKGHGTKLHQIDWRRARTLYVTRGLGVDEVADELGLSPISIRAGLRRRGWLRPKRPLIRTLKHGPALYQAWHDMGARVGARGIRVSPQWADFVDFHAWALGAGYRKGLVLTRLDRAKDYGPNNCRWMTRTAANRLLSRSRRT